MARPLLSCHNTSTIAANPKPRLTEEEYLTQERKAEFKSEYLNGEVFAMAGGTLRHARLITNFARILGNQLVESSCEVITQDMRVQVSPGGLYTYPNILAFCGPPSFLDETEDTLLNPILIAEVLSDSTRNYDLGGKFDLYRLVPTLREYVTVEHSAIHIITRQRQEDGSWLLRDYTDFGGNLPLSSVSITIPIAEIYRNVSFTA
jgi:Uma2 family endonuclease